MSVSLSRWLALREPADFAARSEALTQVAVEAVSPAGVVSVLDLGSGTGSNLRFLADRLPGRQRWLLVDRDPVLLRLVLDRVSAWSAMRGYDVTPHANGCLVRGAGLECRIATQQVDLDRLEDVAIVEGRHLVTASALLDLVSERWLRTLARQCRSAGAAALFAITYNGRSACAPAEPEDDLVRQLMNRHQRTDKGLGGAAAGPEAAALAERCFAAEGYGVKRVSSDWVLGPEDDELQRELIEGWVEAAAEIAPDRAAVFSSWKRRRLEHVAARRSRITVGHDDLAAWLPRD